MSNRILPGPPWGNRIMKYIFLRHRETEDIFAVRMNEEGKITGAAGPLPARSLKNSLLPHFIYFRSIGEFIGSNSDEYLPCEGEKEESCKDSRRE
jgi:hypothetical protein